MVTTAEAVTKKEKKKEKKKKQTYDKVAALKYNKLMYGPLSCEQKKIAPKVNYGAGFIGHEKFKALLSAFKNNTPYKFEIKINDKSYTVATDGTHISFDNIVVCYSRPSNRFEDLMLLDRNSLIQHNNTAGVIHLVFGVLKSLPELKHSLTYVQHKFYWEAEGVDKASDAEYGANILVGPFKHQRFQDRPERMTRR
jgi:hypothetical protein